MGGDQLRDPLALSGPEPLSVPLKCWASGHLRKVIYQLQQPPASPLSNDLHSLVQYFRNNFNCWGQHFPIFLLEAITLFSSILMSGNVLWFPGTIDCFCRSFGKECQTSCILVCTQEDWWSLSAFKSYGMLFRNSLGSLKHPILSTAFILKKVLESRIVIKIIYFKEVFGTKQRRKLYIFFPLLYFS